ncbi:MAG: DUF4193 family protein [Acidimicrobiia bacterium]|jgi:hypothetical protein
MSDDVFEEDEVGDEEIEELEEIDEDLVEDLDLEEDLDAEIEVDPLVDEVLEGESIATPKPASTLATDEDEDDTDVLDLDEELHPDDVEAPLDALLQERTASATIDEEEEELEDEEGDADVSGDGPTRIVPRRPGEFLCSSCFLVLPRHQLADEERMLCRDCA